MSTGVGHGLPREDVGNSMKRCGIGSETALQSIICSPISAFNASAAADRTAASPTALFARRSRSGLSASVAAGPPSRGDLADNAQASFAAFRAWTIRGVVNPSLPGGVCLFGLDRGSDLRQALTPAAVGQETEMAYPHETFW